MDPAEIQSSVRAGPATASIQLLPYRHTKIVHFIRHGEGYHNLTRDYGNWAYEDAHLTPAGWQQAYQLRKHVSELPNSLQLQAVIVSPLTRAIETAIGAFGGAVCQEGDTVKPLMIAQNALEGKQHEHAAVSSEGCPPFIVHEGCREHLGCNPCDRRAATSTLRQRYPGLDFSTLADDEDTLWTVDQRESTAALLARGVAFVQWLMARPESRLAVVTHSSFLFHLMANFGQQAAPPVTGELHRWYNNCELRSVVLSDPQGDYTHPDIYHFAGHLPQAEQGLKVTA